MTAQTEPRIYPTPVTDQREMAGWMSREADAYRQGRQDATAHAATRATLREVCVTCRFDGPAALHVGPPGLHEFYRVRGDSWTGLISSTFRAARLTESSESPEQRRIRNAPEHSEEGWSR